MQLSLRVQTVRFKEGVQTLTLLLYFLPTGLPLPYPAQRTVLGFSNSQKVKLYVKNESRVQYWQQY